MHEEHKGWSKLLRIATTKPQEMLEITQAAARCLLESGIRDGICHLFVLHTTAAITVNENCDPAVAEDILVTLERLIPVRGSYRHGEGNSHAHLKAALLGNHVTLAVSEGKLLLGTWQGIFLAEFDGPRTRSVLVRISR